MNIFLCGQKSFGRAVLSRLITDGHKIIGVAAPPQEKYYDKMKGLAIKERVPVIIDSDKLRPDDIPDGVDLIVAAHAHHFISAKTRARAKLGAIGFHPSALPRHRGMDAVRWAVAMGDPITGGTVYWLDDVVDGGQIVLQRFIHIHKSWDHHKVWEKIFPIGVEIISGAVYLISAGNAKSEIQNEMFATWEPSFDVPRLYRPDLLQIGQGE